MDIELAETVYGDFCGVVGEGVEFGFFGAPGETVEPEGVEGADFGTDVGC